MSNKLLGSLSLFFAAAICSFAQPHPSSEAQYLETMYGQFSYLVSITPVVEAALKAHIGAPQSEGDVSSKIDNAKLDISLSGIKSGPIAEILDQPLSAVYEIAQAPQQVLHVQVNTDEFQDVDQPKVSWQVADAKWATADPALPKDVFDFFSKRPVKLILADEENRLKTGLTYSRYATYTVTVHFQAKTMQYKAFAVFAVDPKDGDVKALPEDNFLLTNSFHFGGGMNYYPKALLQSRLAHEYQPLQQFLKAHTVDDQKCATGHICCVGNSCGIASADLNRELGRQQP